LGCKDVAADLALIWSRPSGRGNFGEFPRGKGLDDLGYSSTERYLKKAKGANFLVILLHGKNFSVNVEYP
jgi:hypothetical protein